MLKFRFFQMAVRGEWENPPQLGELTFGGG